jgi:cytochrome c oxidase cbb3-type subunit 3
MPAFGRAGILNDAQIAAVADYVLSLSGRAQANKEGKQIFADNCAACHGPDGRGNKDLGAPNLTDAIWLYGSDRATVMGQIHDARNSVMPAWSGKLTDVQIKEVALYVHGLGGGQ